MSIRRQCGGHRDKGGEVIFEDHFYGPELDRAKWLPLYLPHWSTAEASAARFEIAESRLRLFIAEDQEPWCPEFDGDVRVSNLQTGHFAGPIGSQVGQHRFRSGLVVRTDLPPVRLFLMKYGRLEMRARARLNPWNLASLWLIGFEDRPERSGEITFFEAFGQELSDGGARIGRGIKKINDPKLVDDLDNSPRQIDVEDWHVYAMDWTPSGITFHVEGVCVSRTAQSPDYPMQLMLNLYDLPSGVPRSGAREAWFDIDYIRVRQARP